MLGTTISHYRIIEKFGGGGMGVVYKAEDLKLKRTVALKFLPLELTRDEEAKQRFIHEAQAASALQHHNICTVHDIEETPDGQLFIVMDLYEGETLKKKIERGGLNIEEATEIAAQIARGLAKAHEKGIVHRDIKPANILITRDGVVKIVDFGLAKFTGSSQITKAGRTLGTTLYMSPEQLKGEDVDARTDIWSFGVLLYQMLTGIFPFRAEFDEALMYQISCAEPPPVNSLQPAIPTSLSDLVTGCLQKDKEQRPQSMIDILHKLGRETGYMMAAPKTIGAAKWILIAGTVLAVLALAIYFSGDVLFKTQAKDLRMAVLPFIDLTKDTSIAAYRPEIQRSFINKLLDVKIIKVEDGLRLNAELERRFGNDNPPRTDLLFRFLRQNGYEFVLDGSITNSPMGGYSLSAGLRIGEAYDRVEEFQGRLLTRSQIDSVVQALSRQVIAYLNSQVLDRRAEMGIWHLVRPKNWAAVAKLEDAYTYYCKGDQPSANAALVESMELDSTFISPRIWFTATQRRSDLEGARRNLRMLQRLRSSADDFQKAMIDWLGAYLASDPESQIRSLTKALKFEPQNRIVLANLAGAHTEKHDTAGALRAYRYCIESRWEFKLFYPVAVRYYLGQRNFVAAKEALNVWRQIDTSSVAPWLYGWLSTVHLRLGDTTEAGKWKDKFLTVCGDSTIQKIEYMLGGCYADAGFLVEGETLLRSALAKEENNADFHERLGGILLSKGITDGAVREFENALQLNPKSKTPSFKLGNIFKQKGDTTRALDHFRKYLRLDSLSYDAQEMQKWIREHRL